MQQYDLLWGAIGCYWYSPCGATCPWFFFLIASSSHAMTSHLVSVFILPNRTMGLVIDKKRCFMSWRVSGGASKSWQVTADNSESWRVEKTTEMKHAWWDEWKTRRKQWTGCHGVRTGCYEKKKMAMECRERVPRMADDSTRIAACRRSQTHTLWHRLLGSET
jgi:hypothetical protein